jgi:hypothetical protein
VEAASGIRIRLGENIHIDVERGFDPIIPLRELPRDQRKPLPKDSRSLIQAAKA